MSLISEHACVLGGNTGHSERAVLFEVEQIVVKDLMKLICVNTNVHIGVHVYYTCITSQAGQGQVSTHK